MVSQACSIRHLSSILKWFGEDFGESLSERLRALYPYFPEPVQQALKNGQIEDVKYLDYDWSLNDQRRKQTARR